MHTTNLRKVGGSIMLAVPPALLDILHLRPGAKVGIAVPLGEGCNQLRTRCECTNSRAWLAVP
jgi:antitoxin component of MazEF toxin-antitoxin module